MSVAEREVKSKRRVAESSKEAATSPDVKPIESDSMTVYHKLRSNIAESLQVSDTDIIVDFYMNAYVVFGLSSPLTEITIEHFGEPGPALEPWSILVVATLLNIEPSKDDYPLIEFQSKYGKFADSCTEWASRNNLKDSLERTIELYRGDHNRLPTLI